MSPSPLSRPESTPSFHPALDGKGSVIISGDKRKKQGDFVAPHPWPKATLWTRDLRGAIICLTKRTALWDRFV